MKTKNIKAQMIFKQFTVLWVGLTLIGCTQTAQLPKGSSGEQPIVIPIQEPYGLTQEQKDRINHIKVLKLEFDEMVELEQESSALKWAEAKKSEETYYVYSDGTLLYDAVDAGQSTQSLMRKDSVRVMGTLKNATGVAFAEIQALNGLPSKGYIQLDQLVKTPQSFIAQKYEGVEYEAISKSEGFSENPRVKVKAIYVTQTSFASAKLDDLIKIANETEINAFVIDVKDDYGNTLFYSKAAEEICPDANGKSGVRDIQERMNKLKENNIYAIARIVSFRSPRYATRYPERAITYNQGGGLYKQGDGLPWASAYDEDLWAYNVAICKEAAEVGFNEIQFDYVRFPATGSKLDKTLDFNNTKEISKAVAIQQFLIYAREELKASQVYITADIFGWAATQLSDVEIGQHWEALSNVVDYIAPMMYPSHYGTHNFGLAVPDAHPYETIFASGEDAMDRNSNLNTPAIIRPWIQDFTASWVPGHISYGAEELRAQITALEDLGIDEFMIWNPRNNYSVKGLKKEESE